LRTRAPERKIRPIAWNQFWGGAFGALAGVINLIIGIAGSCLNSINAFPQPWTGNEAMRRILPVMAVPRTGQHNSPAADQAALVIRRHARTVPNQDERRQEQQE
jgi:hypothetical protein